jgi:predicted nucleic acid-binding protein
MARFIVSNTGPLISLEKIQDGYIFIRKLYDRIIVPPKVLEEIISGKYSIGVDYLRAYSIEDLIEVRSASAIVRMSDIERLDEGEIQAISLAVELGLPLLIEETVGRRVALKLGLEISGIAGQVVKAFRHRIVDKAEAASKLQQLLNGGRINQKIYSALMKALT